MENTCLTEIMKDIKTVSGIATGTKNSIMNPIDHLPDDMGHMESPQEDLAHKGRLDRGIDDFFKDKPLPTDPMRAAKLRSVADIAAEEENEILVEIVRERYQRQLHSQKAEQKRLSDAMREYEQSIEEITGE
eukprot:gene22181-8739_t